MQRLLCIGMKKMFNGEHAEEANTIQRRETEGERILKETSRAGRGGLREV